jgi:3-oxoadipate enol-lactonase
MDRVEKGREEYRALVGGDPDTGLAEVRRRSAAMAETMMEGPFAGTLSRPELSRADRELATVAMLAALGGAEKQLATHARAALKQGITRSELVALAEHVSVYAGFPRALNALAVIDEAAPASGAFTPRRVRLNDHETLVVQRGESGPPVVLLHALGLDWRMWEQVMDRLAEGRRVYAYDIRGHGHAQGSPSPFTLREAGDDLIGVLDALGIERAHVVGLSYGGGIAQVAAAAHPERIASLALLATTDHAFEAFEGRARSGEVDGMAAQVVPSLTRWFTPAALAANPWPVRYARERVLRGNPTDWAAAWRAFKGIDVQGTPADLDVPKLVLAGELDASTTPEIMKGVAERLPGAVYRELPGTPHMQSLERPELVAEALDAFLPAG